MNDGVTLLSDRVTLLSGGPVKYLGNPFALTEGKVCLIVFTPFFPAPIPVVTLFLVPLQHMVLIPRAK